MGFQSCLSNASVIYNYLSADLIKKQRSFKIGLISIYLVVFFITMLMNGISLCPTLFIRLSEDQVGEADFIFTPMLSKKDASKISSTWEKVFLDEPKEAETTLMNIQFIDFDDMKKRLENNTIIKGVMPRWILRGNTTNTLEDNSTNWAISTVFILNSKLENKYGMGRKLHLNALKENECYVSHSLYKSLKLDLKTNNEIVVNVRLSAILKSIGQTSVTNLFDQADMNPMRGEDSDSFNYDDDSSSSSSSSSSSKPSESHDGSESKPKDYSSRESSFLRQYISDMKIKQLTLDKKTLLNIIGLKDIPKAAFPLKVLESSFMSSIPIVQTIKDFLKSNSTIISDFFIIDEKEKTIRLKDIGDNIIININAEEILSMFSDNDLDEITTFRLKLKIKEVVPQTSGKWPSATGNVIGIDEAFFGSYIESNMKRILGYIAEKQSPKAVVDLIQQYVDSSMKGFRLSKYAIMVNGIMYNKFDTYKYSQSNQRRYLAKQTESIMESIGFDYPVSISLPIYTAMAALEIAEIFLENIFIGISVFLWLLSVLLIYSLMLGNVDERTYEFGLLRSLGYKKNNILIMIAIQGLIFAIPGIGLGLITSYIVNNYIAFLFNWYAGVVIPYYLNSTTIIWGIVIGLSITLISSYFPIKKALDANLKETLTIFNKKIGDIVVQMIKLEHLGISPSAFLSSIVLITIGFATYYIAPLSFLLMNPSIFIFIMTMIMITMLLGLIIIIQLFIPSLQKVILEIIMFFANKDRNIHFIVRKNLEGHQKRNKKVSIMFMIALGFVIFGGCTLNLLVSFIKTFSRGTMGGDAFFWGFDRNQNTLDQNLLTSYLESTKLKFPDLIKNYSFVSYPLNQIIETNVEFASLNGYPNQKRQVVAIDEKFISSGYPDLYSVTDYDKTLNYSYVPNTKKVDLLSMLYNNNNIPPIISSKVNVVHPKSFNFKRYSIDMQLNVIAAEGIRRRMAIGVSNPCSVSISFYSKQKIPCKVVGLASKLPGSPSYSSYSTLSFLSPIYISNKQMKEIINREMALFNKVNNTLFNSPAMTLTPDGIRKQGFLLKYTSTANSELKQMVYYEIKNIIEDEGSIAFYVDDIIETAETIGTIFEYFFVVLGLIALILSFFLIWISFYCNIKDNICEYGIMRAIGVTENQSMRIYLYEAATIILSSIITGTFIGVVISSTLILQFTVFVELPFVFNFPYKLYTTLVLSGFGLGLLGSYYPTHEVNQMSLVKIMKGLAQ